MARWLQTHRGDRPLLCRSARRHEPGDVPLGRHPALPARRASSRRSSRWRCPRDRASSGFPCLALRGAPGRRRRFGRHGGGAGPLRHAVAATRADRRGGGRWARGGAACQRRRWARDPGRRRCRRRGAEPADRYPAGAARAGRDVGPVPGGRRRGPRRRRRPRRPRHPVARPDPRGQVNARRGAGTAGRTLLLRRVRAHRRRRTHTPVPSAAAAAGRVGLRSTQVGDGAGRNGGARAAPGGPHRGTALCPGRLTLHAKP